MEKASVLVRSASCEDPVAPPAAVQSVGIELRASLLKLLGGYCPKLLI